MTSNIQERRHLAVVRCLCFYIMKVVHTGGKNVRTNYYKFKYVPESALIELCFKCNLNCKHCGSSLNAYKKSRKGEPLSLTEFYSAIDDLKGLGGKRIGLVGGEPLLYENWEEVAKYASDRNFLE